MSLADPQQNKLLPPRIQQLLNSMFARETGFSGPQIIEFFLQYSDEIEPYPQGGGAPSRWQIFEDCLAKFDFEQQRKIILDLLDYEGYMRYPRPTDEDIEKVRHWLGEGPTPITEQVPATVVINWAYANRNRSGGTRYAAIGRSSSASGRHGRREGAGSPV